MTTTIFEEVAAGQADVVPWTVERYRRAIEAGDLPQDASLELLDGLIVRKNRAAAGEDRMSIGKRHRLVVQRLVRIAPQFYPHGCHLQIQQPIVLPPVDEPEPDASVVAGTEEDYATRMPAGSDVRAVIEVADSSLPRDRGTKLRVYAQASVGQYIVINLVEDVVEVYERPSAAAFASRTVLRMGDTLAVACGGSDHVAVAVDYLLG